MLGKLSIKPKYTDYSFCETAHATGSSPWHIRKLTSAGKKLGGGADTPALCGRKVAWDIKANINEFAIKYACAHCQDAFKEIKHDDKRVASES